MNTGASVAIVLASLGLALAYAVQSLYLGGVIIAVLGMACLVGQWRAWRWTAELTLLSLTAGAVAGAWLRLPAAWMITGTVAALGAWDLVHAAQRLRSVQQVEEASTLARAHLVYLLSVSAVALVLGFLAVGSAIRLSFGWALLLGAVVIAGLSRVLVVVRRSSVFSLNENR